MSRSSRMMMMVFIAAMFVAPAHVAMATGADESDELDIASFPEITAEEMATRAAFRSAVKATKAAEQEEVLARNIPNWAKEDLKTATAERQAPTKNEE